MKILTRDRLNLLECFSGALEPRLHTCMIQVGFFEPQFHVHIPTLLPLRPIHLTSTTQISHITNQAKAQQRIYRSSSRIHLCLYQPPDEEINWPFTSPALIPRIENLSQCSQPATGYSTRKNGYTKALIFAPVSLLCPPKRRYASEKKNKRQRSKNCRVLHDLQDHGYQSGQDGSAGQAHFEGGSCAG